MLHTGYSINTLVFCVSIEGKFEGISETQKLILSLENVVNLGVAHLKVNWYSYHVFLALKPCLVQVVRSTSLEG